MMGCQVTHSKGGCVRLHNPEVASARITVGQMSPQLDHGVVIGLFTPKPLTQPRPYSTLDSPGP